MLPLLEKVMQSGKPLADHRRGHRGRGPRDARGEQDPRHVQRRRGEGSRVRRPSQGDAPGHRGPHGRPGDLRGGRPEARERDARPAGRRAQGGRDEGRHDDHRGRGLRGRGQGPRRTRSRPRSRTRTRTGTRRSCRSASPSSPAASRSIKVGAATEVELKEKKHRIEDAVSRDPCGRRRGHRPRRRRHADPCRERAAKLKLKDDEATGANIVRDSLVRAGQAHRGQRRLRGCGHRLAAPRRGRLRQRASTPPPASGSTW